MKKLFVIIIFSLAALSMSAQVWRLNVDASGHLSGSTGDYLPFWQRTYEGGIMPYSSSGVMTVGALVNYVDGNDFSFEAGTNLVGSLAMRNPVHDTEVSGIVDRLYVSGGWRMLHLDVGMKPRARELGNLSLTGGNVIYSGYTRNMPGVNAWSDWIYFEKGRWVGIRGNFAHYQMMDNRYVKDTYIHNKSFAIRFASGRVVDLELGLDHWAQWGGVSPNLGERPSSFKDYLRIIFAQNGGADASMSDQLNALGNHLGREYVRLNWRTSDFKMTFQYDMPFEDGKTIVKVQNFPDGVYSLKFSFNKMNALVTDVLYEFANTTWQSGDEHDRAATEEEMSKDYGKYVYWQDPDHYFYGRIIEGGLDNYFNNREYRSGWTYHGSTIGLPLLIPFAPAKDGVTWGVICNRVRAHHLGLKGYAFRLPYMFKATYSSNWGRYSDEPGSFFSDRPKQLSLALEVELGKQVTDLPVTFAVGLYGDFGKVYQNCAGLSLRVLFDHWSIIRKGF